MDSISKDELLEQIDSIAPQMKAARRSLFGRAHYDLMADALYWKDERPDSLDDEESGLLRFVLRYRTSLILGKPDAEYEEYWTRAKKAFPEWIGFREERCAPSEKLKLTYERLKQA